tara:strand:+ start:140 stop:355 length:216 start_codon:yes stop_codon:yes gene_type:complete
MARYKLVNGKKIKFTDAEEKIRDDEEKKAEQDRLDQKTALETKQANKTSGRNKLKDLGLTEDEINALVGNP